MIYYWSLRWWVKPDGNERTDGTGRGTLSAFLRTRFILFFSFFRTEGVRSTSTPTKPRVHRNDDRIASRFSWPEKHVGTTCHAHVTLVACSLCDDARLPDRLATVLDFQVRKRKN